MCKLLTSVLLMGLLAAAAPAAVTFDWLEIATGTDIDGTLYNTYDLQLTVSTNLTNIQMYIRRNAGETPAAGDFYQDAVAGSEFDTHFSVPAPMELSTAPGVPIGQAINILAGDRSATFDDKLLDIAWGPDGDPASGSGMFTVARVTVKQGLMYGSWQVYANETGSPPIPGFSDSGILPLYSALDGDAGLNGSVTLSDLSILAQNYNLAGGWGQGDFNDSGDITLADLSILAQNYNTTWTPSEPLLAGPSAVPEPTTVVLLAFGALCLAGRARRR